MCNCTSWETEFCWEKRKYAQSACRSLKLNTSAVCDNREHQQRLRNSLKFIYLGHYKDVMQINHLVCIWNSDVRFSCMFFFSQQLVALSKPSAPQENLIDNPDLILFPSKVKISRFPLAVQWQQKKENWRHHLMPDYFSSHCSFTVLILNLGKA